MDARCRGPASLSFASFPKETGGDNATVCGRGDDTGEMDASGDPTGEFSSLDRVGSDDRGDPDGTRSVSHVR